MRKLLMIVLIVNASLLGVRVWQESSSVRAGEARVGTENGDVNGDGRRDISDAVHLLDWLFQGGPDPVACADSPELTGRVSSIEAMLAEHENRLIELSSRVSSISSRTPTVEQAEILSYLSIEETFVDSDERTVPTVRLSGANFQVVNGLGATNGNPDDPVTGQADQSSTNGTGNLIIGYQHSREEYGQGVDVRTGSHNLVVGAFHNYTGYGGFVAGRSNHLDGRYCSIAGGSFNSTSGSFATVSSGCENRENRACSGERVNNVQPMNLTYDAAAGYLVGITYGFELVVFDNPLLRGSSRRHVSTDVRDFLPINS
jgi:hypothetical protein